MSLSERSSNNSVLSYRHLSYSVRTKDGPKKLLDDVSVDVHAGELLGILVRRMTGLYRRMLTALS